MKALLEKRAKIFDEARAIVLKAEAEKRSLTGEEMSQYDAMMADVKALGETIDRSKQSSEFNAELDNSIGPLNSGGKRTANGSDLIDSAMDTFIRKGGRSLTSEQRGAFGTAFNGDSDQLQLRAASPLSDVTGTAGAYTVPQGFLAQLEIAQKWFGGMRTSNARILRTATGNTLPYPNLNDTGNIGELVAENTQVSQAATEMSFGKITLGAYKYSSKLVLVPIELLQDSAFDVQSFVASSLGNRLGRVQNNHFTVGTGSSQPTGIVTAATLGVTGATGETAKWIYDDIVNLIHSVDPAYPRPSYTILGYPVVINNDMPAMAASAKSALFGDFSRYIIRDVMDLMLVRFGEKCMDNGQIGFVAFQRADGNLQDAGSHPVRWFANSAT